jgi:excisionase family DNA binding protein
MTAFTLTLNGFRLTYSDYPGLTGRMTTNFVAPTTVSMHNVTEAAALAGISKRYMEMLIADGSGPAVTRIGRRVLIRDDRLREWIDRQTEAEDAAMGQEEQELAALVVLRAVEYRLQGDGAAMTRTLRGTGREVSLRLLEATEIIAHLLKHSDRPEQVLAALLQSVGPTN